MNKLLVALCFVIGVLSFEVYQLNERIEDQRAVTFSLMASVSILLQDKLDRGVQLQHNDLAHPTGNGPGG